MYTDNYRSQTNAPSYGTIANLVRRTKRVFKIRRKKTIYLCHLQWNSCENSKQEAQLPLREQGVSFVLSSYHNANLSNLAFLSLVIHYVWDF